MSPLPKADRKQQEHKLVRGAIPFNIEAQRWINPIDKGDRIGWFLGKVLLLHFWATWSPESVEQLAHYDELYKKHKDQGLVVIAIHSAEGSRRCGRLHRRTRLYVAHSSGRRRERTALRHLELPPIHPPRPRLSDSLAQRRGRNAESSPTEVLARRQRQVSDPLTPSERFSP